MAIVVETTNPILGSGLTGAAILDAFSSRIQDNSAALRQRALSWLSTLFQQLYLERDWMCLRATAAVTIESDTVVKPTDFGRFGEYGYLKTVDWFLGEQHRLSGREAFDLADPNAANPTPVGFEEDATTLLLVPGASDGDATLRYIRLLPAPTDDNIPTPYSWQFLPLFESSLLTAYYEFDKDKRLAVRVQLDAQELSRLKVAENRQRPLPKNNTQGYLREPR